MNPVFGSETWELRLYVAGQTPRSLTAFVNLRQICERYLAGRYTIETVDLVRNPERARADGILAIPTIVRVQPAPFKKLVGDLSNTEDALNALDLTPSL